METPTFRPDPEWDEQVEALAQEPFFQECVSLVRAGLSWRDALIMEPHERRAFMQVYSEQEQAAWEAAEERAAEKERQRPSS